LKNFFCFIFIRTYR